MASAISMVHLILLLGLSTMGAAQTPLVDEQEHVQSNGTDSDLYTNITVSDGDFKDNRTPVSNGTNPIVNLGPQDEEEPNESQPLQEMEDRPNITSSLRVVMALHTPYVIQNPMRHSSVDGLIPDLLHRLGKHVGVSFQSYLVADGQYGSQDANSSWNGMIGELLPNKEDGTSNADLAAGPLTITKDRQKIVSFLHPFLHGGLTAVIKKPHLDRQPRSLVDSVYMSVLQPLDTGIWISIIVCCLLVGIGLWLMNYFNPYEWGGRYNVGRATEAAAESFNFTGSLWFAFSTLQWQGFDRMPRAISSKLLAIFWMVFVTLAILIYTASIVTNIFWASTRHGPKPTQLPFLDLAHLAIAQKELGYDYGLVRDSPAHNYIANVAQGGEYDTMRQYFSQTGGATLVGNLHEGIRRAQLGKYALITDLMSAQFFINRQPCDLMVLNKVVAQQTYGMAVSKQMNPQLVESLERAILEIIESGEMDFLQQKWLKDRSDCWNETSSEWVMSELFSNGPHRVSRADFAGPLIILVVGIIISLLVAVAEWLYYRYKGKYQRANHAGGRRLQNAEETG